MTANNGKIEAAPTLHIDTMQVKPTAAEDTRWNVFVWAAIVTLMLAFVAGSVVYAREYARTAAIADASARETARQEQAELNRKAMAKVTAAAETAASAGVNTVVKVGVQAMEANGRALEVKLSNVFGTFTALNSGPVGVLLQADDNRWIYATDAVERISGGKTLEELVGLGSPLVSEVPPGYSLTPPADFGPFKDVYRLDYSTRVSDRLVRVRVLIPEDESEVTE